MAVASANSFVFPPEAIKWGSGVPQLAYFRLGSIDKPLVLFFPGGGHLARVAYGHPGSNRRDFLDFWLAEAGYSLLALSFPSDYPAFDKLYPELTVSAWSASGIAIAKELIERHQLPKQVIAAGWSMGGRVARAVNVAAAESGLSLDCFISLSATPPIGGLSKIYPEGGAPEVTPDLLWDSGDMRRKRFVAELQLQATLAGHPLISEADCKAFYWANTPLHLLGDLHRVKGDRIVEAAEEALADIGSLDFKNYPLTGAISASGPSDARHALTDAATWAFTNAQKIFADWLSSPGVNLSKMPAEAWSKLLAMMLDLPARMSRHVEGTHFFFIGEPGARRTAEHMVSLHDESVALRQEIRQLLAGQI